MGTSPFVRTTTVRPRAGAAGGYEADIGPEWNCPIVPHGGLVTATAARAMAVSLHDPAQTLRSVTTVFTAQVEPGRVEIDTTVLRRGRSISQLGATLRNPGAPSGHTSIAVFGAPRRGFTFTDVEPPDVPAPADCPSFRDPRPPDFEQGPHFNFWDHVEGRPALGHAPWDDYEPASSLRAAWYRFDDPPIADDGRWDPLALVTLCDTMPGAVSERLGPRTFAEDQWLPPSADLTVHVLGEAHSEWVLAVNRARRAADGYASCEMELWDMDAGSLVAYATQVMFFTFLTGDR